MSTQLNPAQINTSIFGMASAVFTSMAAVLVTTAVKGNILVDKTANTLIHGVSAAENVACAVEQRSKIYGDGMVENGRLAERETQLKYLLRLANLERQEEAVRNGTATFTPEVPEPTFGARIATAIKGATATPVIDSAIAVGESVKITPYVAVRT